MYATQKNICDIKPSVNPDAVCGKYLRYPDKTGKRQLEGGLRTKGQYKQSLSGKPLITVITVVCNDVDTLERCIKSVLEQTYENIEYIVIDGGSTDGTLNIIKKHEDAIDYFISEHDSGIYYAMNKGIALANGDYLIFMNSDDWFSSNKSIEQIIPYNNTLKDNIIYGKIMYYLGNKAQHENSPLAVDENILAGHPIPHQATFIPKKSFNIIGNYDTKLSLAADYDWWVRAKLHNIVFTNTKKVLANFSSGGSNHQSFLLGQLEAIISLYNHKVETVGKPLNTDKFSKTLEKSTRSELKILLERIPHNYNIEVLLNNLITPKISIIIPVFNASRYLKKCLISVLNQTLKEIEIIIVNDCSPDPKDNEICDEYANKDNRITYIKHSQNKRQGGARNTALNIARGEYIWFVDADDFIDINACEFLYNTAKDIDIDVLAFSANSYHIKGDKSVLDYSGGYYTYERNRKLYKQKLSGYEFIKLFQDIVSPCLYLFSRDLFREFRFRENVLHEDIDLIPIILFNAKHISTVKYSPYFRLLREDSTTQMKWTESRLINYFESLESLFEYTNKNPSASSGSLKNICGNRYRYLFNELLPKIDIESIEVNIHINRLQELHEILFDENDKPPVNSQEQSISNKSSTNKSIRENQKILNDKWYRFGQMSWQRKIWITGKVISKKMKLYWLLQPVVKKIKSCMRNKK